MHAFTKAIEVFEAEIEKINRQWAIEEPLNHWAIITRDEQLSPCLFGIELLQAAYEEEMRQLQTVATKREQESLQAA